MNVVIDRTTWPGQPGSQASVADTYVARWTVPPQVDVTVPATLPRVATVTFEIPAWVAVRSAVVVGPAYLNGSTTGSSSSGRVVVVVVVRGGGRGRGRLVVPGGRVVVVVVGAVGGGVGWPSTATRTSSVRPSITRSAASTMQAPAWEV